jgi:hypothetical protein
MTKHILFLKWWLFAILITLGLYIAYSFNIFHTIWEQDITKLSFIIIALFVFATIWCGSATWKISKALAKNSIDPKALKNIEYAEDSGWFISDVLLTIGMIGTVCGFIIMLLGGFADVDVSNPSTIQSMLSKLSAGMATALFTTLAGLITSVLLKVQYFNLTKGIEKFRGKE